MKISSIHLKNFKRFTDVVVSKIPESAKLVVVVGPNGCGKSSLFDALLHWYKGKVGFGFNQDFLYYRKHSEIPFGWHETVEVKLHGEAAPVKGCLYVRTAYRNDPDFNIGGINRPAAPSESVRFSRVIENDQTVSDNYQRLVYDTMASVYDASNDAKTVVMLREELIGKIRASMRAVFGDLVLKNISDPLGAGAFYFDKGTANGYHYKNLSGGEKAAFDLLLDMHVKRKFFADAVYCIDEMETHLHTRVQGTLLKELFKLLPDTSQLWVTTHSIGVLRAAQELNKASPGSVCMIDFDAVDSDTPRLIEPSSLGRVSWEKLLSIALDDLASSIAPGVVVVCEGSSVGTRRKDFDAEIYNRIFGDSVENIVFVSGGSSNQVAAHGISVRRTLSEILPTSRVLSLCDRDDKSGAEVAAFEANNGVVLSLRNIESYLLADDAIESLVKSQQKDALLQGALEIKQNAIAASVTRGNAPDDLKSASGEIYVGLKRLLALQWCGNTSDSFLRDTMAPLLKAGMPSYEALKAAVVDRVLAR